MLEAEKAQLAAKHEEHARGFEAQKKSALEEHESVIRVLQADLHDALGQSDALAADHEQLVVDHEQVGCLCVTIKSKKQNYLAEIFPGVNLAD